MPKKRVVASLVGNFSPVKSRTAILVSRVRHFLGEMGEELKSRAVQSSVLEKTGRGRGLYHLERRRYGPA